LLIRCGSGDLRGNLFLIHALCLEFILLQRSACSPTQCRTWFVSKASKYLAIISDICLGNLTADLSLQHCPSAPLCDFGGGAVTTTQPAPSSRTPHCSRLYAAQATPRPTSNNPRRRCIIVLRQAAAQLRLVKAPVLSSLHGTLAIRRPRAHRDRSQTPYISPWTTTSGGGLPQLVIAAFLHNHHRRTNRQRHIKLLRQPWSVPSLAHPSATVTTSSRIHLRTLRHRSTVPAITALRRKRSTSNLPSHNQVI
jgi:hypothetical protein